MTGFAPVFGVSSAPYVDDLVAQDLPGADLAAPRPLVCCCTASAGPPHSEEIGGVLLLVRRGYFWQHQFLFLGAFSFRWAHLSLAVSAEVAQDPY